MIVYGERALIHAEEAAHAVSRRPIGGPPMLNEIAVHGDAAAVWQM